MHKKNLLSLILPILISLSPESISHGQEMGSSSDIKSTFVCNIPPDLLDAEEQAVEWIKRRIVPNDIVPEPDPARRRLMISYDVPENDPAYPYIYSRSFIYDDALGAIALTMTGNYRESERTLSALGRLIREDGSLWFTYNTANSWPNETDHEGAIIRTGAIAWVGYAFTFYLNVRQQEDKSFLSTDIIAQKYLKYSERLAEYVVQRQILSGSDMRYGLITGGWGLYDVKIKSEEKTPDKLIPFEELHKTEIKWVSMEHNIDIYFFLRDLGRLTGKKVYVDAAEMVKKGLMRLWNEESGQFIRGVKGNQVADAALPLDGASWGALFLFSTGENLKAEKCLNTIDENFFCDTGTLRGYKPYYKGTVYEDKEVNAFYFPEDPEKQWGEIDIVWGEGTLGVGAAYVKAGKIKKALKITESIMLLQKEGGFKYASNTVPYQFNDYPSIASTAWFVIALELLKGTPTGALFWSSNGPRSTE